MANRDILALGTSAGGFMALRHLAARFRPGLPASVLVVIHLPSEFNSALDVLLTQAGPLPAKFAADGDPLERGQIYIAPPASHLLVDGARLRLGRGPRENHARPAIDPLLRSAALCCGPRTVGIVLTGTLGDGASGLAALKQCGGVTVVQDPDDAAFPEMPTAALRNSKPDHVVGLQDMPSLIEALLNQPAGAAVAIPEPIRQEVEIARNGYASPPTTDRVAAMDCLGRRSVLACPDCHGVMWELEDGDLVRYHCHVGHAYVADRMSLELDESLARALASALRALDDRISLVERLKQQAEEANRQQLVRSWTLKARELEEQATVIRDAMGRADKVRHVPGAASRTFVDGEPVAAPAGSER
jgi:two-component system chemotaxis response regulator CheB